MGEKRKKRGKMVERRQNKCRKRRKAERERVRGGTKEKRE